MFKGDYKFITPYLINIINSIHIRSTNNTGLLLRIYVSYDGQQEIVNAVNKCSTSIDINTKNFGELIDDAPPLDLLIRTSGEKRVSNFMLWQIAYAELYFTSLHWPDFNERELQIALTDFNYRKRRFGKLDTSAHIFPHIFENIREHIEEHITNDTSNISLSTKILENRICSININLFIALQNVTPPKLTNKWINLALVLFKLEYRYKLFSSNTGLIRDIVSTQVDNIYNLSMILNKYLPEFGIDSVKNVYFTLEDIHIETLKKINYFIGIANNCTAQIKNICAFILILYPIFIENGIETDKSDILYLSYLAKGISCWINRDSELSLYFINYWLSLPIPANIKKYEEIINSLIDLTLCIVMSKLPLPLQKYYSQEVIKFANSLNYEQIHNIFLNIILR